METHRAKYEVARWPNPPGGLPSLYRIIGGRRYEFQPPDRGYLRLSEAATILKVNTVTLWRWRLNPVRRAEIGLVKVRGQWKVRATQLKRHIERAGTTSRAGKRAMFLGG